MFRITKHKRLDIELAISRKKIRLDSPFSFDLQGFVAFSSQGDRIALTQIEQVINGNYVVLGYYDTQADNLTWFDREVWRGKSDRFVGAS